MTKHIEIRRHALRNKPNKHISQAGITIARRAGEAMGHFDVVISSTLPRSFETAIAMGYEVQQRSERIESYGDKVEKEVPWPQPFSAYQAAYQLVGPAWEYMQDLAVYYTKLAESLPEGGSALVVSHGGIVEMSAVACLPEADYGAEVSVEPCEGVRLAWDGGKFTSVEFIRIP